MNRKEEISESENIIFLSYFRRTFDITNPSATLLKRKKLQKAILKNIYFIVFFSFKYYKWQAWKL